MGNPIESTIFAHKEIASGLLHSIATRWSMLHLTSLTRHSPPHVHLGCWQQPCPFDFFNGRFISIGAFGACIGILGRGLGSSAQLEGNWMRRTRESLGKYRENMEIFKG